MDAFFTGQVYGRTVFSEPLTQPLPKNKFWGEELAECGRF
jgi:hypothetical protein